MTYHFIIRTYIREKCTSNICVRFTHKRRSCIVTLPIKISEDKWDKAIERSASIDTNNKLEKYILIINTIISNQKFKGDYKVEDLATAFKDNLKGHNLLLFTENLATSYIQLNQVRTARAYISSVERLTNFYTGKDLLISDINSILLMNFERHLYNEGLSRNTISFYMRNLRAIYNRALEMGLVMKLEETPFAKAYTGIDITRKRALRKNEVNTIINLNLANYPRLEFARCIFFFCFYACGMSFVDMAYLQKKDIKGKYLKYRRKKTGRFIQVKITKPLQNLIDYFKKFDNESSYLLPILTVNDTNDRKQYESALRKQNSDLKKIGKMCKLQSPLSTHVCRHSWASFAKSIDTPLAVISECLGHSNEKTTYIYLASFEKQVINKATERVNRLINSSFTTTNTIPVPRKLYKYE